MLQELKQIVRGHRIFRAAEASGKLIRLPTGDGMALLFFRSPEEPVRCALEIGRILQDLRRSQSGWASIADLSVKLLMSTTGQTSPGRESMTQRVMDCGDAGHILLSKHLAEDLAVSPLAGTYDLGECEVSAGCGCTCLIFIRMASAIRKSSRNSGEEEGNTRLLLACVQLLIPLA